MPEARDLLLTHYAEPAERDGIIPVNTICVPEVRHYGLPFSDKGFDGQKRTIEVREIIQLSAGTWRQKRMARKFWLYAISKPYYDYLVSSIINRTDNKGIQGGLIDLGLADPVKIFSNVDGGVGIVGCYTSDSQTIDVIKEIGPFPKY